jgi:hypothetical protein
MDVAGVESGLKMFVMPLGAAVSATVPTDTNETMNKSGFRVKTERKRRAESRLFVIRCTPYCFYM